MDWDALTDGVFRTVTNVFGSTVLYTPSGGSSITIQGVYRDQYLEVDSQSGYPIATEQPHISVRNLDLNFRPRQGDLVTIDNNNFKVKSVQKDGEAGTIIFLHKTGTNSNPANASKWKDLADNVFRTVTNVFGSTVLYTPFGGSAIEIQGVYRDQYLEVDGQSGYTIATEQPHISVRNLDLNFRPRQGDLIQVKSRDFIAKSVQKDGEAGTIIFLHELESRFIVTEESIFITTESGARIIL